MEIEGERLRWGTEQRLEFIEFMAFWEGGVRRADITGRFGVSVPQASNDLTLYQRLGPSNLRYDSSEKRYVPTQDFNPRFLRPNADGYLAQLKAIADHSLRKEDTWIVQPPHAGVMPIPARRVEPNVLKGFIATIRAAKSVEVLYQSMNANRPEAVWRRITPHAFANDGLRWHVRAFCHLDSKFKDFILSRCHGMRDERQSGAQPEDDAQWNTFFDVILRPNPELTDSQQRTIAMDYNMRDGQAVVPMRRALLYYFEKRLRLDIDQKKDRPAEKPVVVANWDEFDIAREEAVASK